MKRLLFFILLFIPLFCFGQNVDMAHDYNFVMPFDAINGDDIGAVAINYNRDTLCNVCSIVYSEVQDTANAFTITSGGKIELSDAAKLQQSKTFKYTYRITDSTMTDDASVYIYVAHSDSIVNQTPASYNDNNFTSHYYYFYYRDSTYSSHPQIDFNVNDVFIGARGNGALPYIDAGSNTYAFDINNEDTVILENLEITGNSSNAIRVTISDYSILRNLYIHGISTSTVDLHMIFTTNVNAETPEYLKILNCILDSVGSEGFYGRSKHLEFAYNKCMHCGWAPAGTGCVMQLNCVADYYHVHHNYMSTYGSLTGKGVISCSHDYDPEPGGTCGEGNGGPWGILEDNWLVASSTNEFGFGTIAEGDTIRRNFIEAPDGCGTDCNGIKPGNGFYIYNNIVEGFDRAIYTRYHNVNIWNNIFTDVIRAIDSYADDNNTIVSKNNLFNNCNYYYYIHQNVVLTSDYNFFDSIGYWREGTSSDLTLEDWQMNGYDANSFCNIPTFIDTIRYRPLSTSYQVDSATSVTWVLDLDHKTIPSGIAGDIGPYEYQLVTFGPKEILLYDRKYKEGNRIIIFDRKFKGGSEIKVHNTK
jgi:hypothetical protein